METINAKITAALLWAKLVLTEGRYEQWEKLFQTKLEKESGVQWQSEGWDESDQHYLLTLSYPATRTSVVLRFGTTMNGNYDFVDALIQAPGVKQQRAATAKGISSKVPNVDNGDQLIEALVKDLNQRGLLKTKVAAGHLQAAILNAGIGQELLKNPAKVDVWPYIQENFKKTIPLEFQAIEPTAVEFHAKFSIEGTDATLVQYVASFEAKHQKQMLELVVKPNGKVSTVNIRNFK